MQNSGISHPFPSSPPGQFIISLPHIAGQFTGHSYPLLSRGPRDSCMQKQKSLMIKSRKCLLDTHLLSLECKSLALDNQIIHRVLQNTTSHPHHIWWDTQLDSLCQYYLIDLIKVMKVIVLKKFYKSMNVTFGRPTKITIGTSIRVRSTIAWHIFWTTFGWNWIPTILGKCQIGKRN